MKPVVGIVVALPAEARALTGWVRWQRIEKEGFFLYPHDGNAIKFLYIRAGIGPAHAQKAAQWLVAYGVSALASVGVAGGLSPSVQVGDLIVAEEVIEQVEGTDDSVWTTDQTITDTACKAIGCAGLPVHRGRILTSSQPALGVDHKKSLYNQTYALTVDMESAAVAHIAREAHLPLFVMRAVSDSPTTPVPQAIYSCLDDTGKVKLALLLGQLLRRPSLIVDLLRLKKDFAAALRALSNGWHVVIKSLPGLPIALKSQDHP